MKVKFNWDRANKEVVEKSTKRVKEAAEFMADRVRAVCPVGTISRPMYKSGPYAGQPWTSVDAGRLKKSIRVTAKHGGKEAYLANLKIGVAGDPGVGSVRVYAGHYMAWYAKIVEFYTPFFRPAIEASKPGVTKILEHG